MKRKIQSLTLVMVMALTLAACGSNTASSLSSESSFYLLPSAKSTPEPTLTPELTVAPSLELLPKVTVTTEPSLPPESTSVPTPAQLREASHISDYKEFPILMYHTSSEENPEGNMKSLYVKPSEFEKQISYLVDEGYTFCTFDDYESVSMYERPIFITWDDGYCANYTEIFPLLQRYNIKITLFLTWKNLSPNGLTEAMVKEMSDSGLVKVESHTLTHPSLPILSNETLETQLADSKSKIEELTGKLVLALAYPAGEFDDVVKELAAVYYSYGLRKDQGINNTNVDPFEIRRVRINRDTSLESLKELIKP